jgi:hypothetical protein
MVEPAGKPLTSKGGIESIADGTPIDTRLLMETRLIERAWKDQEFRNAVVRDPKGMLEKRLGRKLPDQVRVFIHEFASGNFTAANGW